MNPANTENTPRFKSGIFSHVKTDISAGVVVFLIALPLCLGISLASGAPLFAGIIAGIIGGIVVGTLSGASINVSGPAASVAPPPAAKARRRRGEGDRRQSAPRAGGCEDTPPRQRRCRDSAAGYARP